MAFSTFVSNLFLKVFPSIAICHLLSLIWQSLVVVVLASVADSAPTQLALSIVLVLTVHSVLLCDRTVTCDLDLWHCQLGDLCDAEDALTEANVLNNLEPEVWAYLCLLCLDTERLVEAEQAYKYTVKVEHTVTNFIANGTHWDCQQYTALRLSLLPYPPAGSTVQKLLTVMPRFMTKFATTYALCLISVLIFYTSVLQNNRTSKLFFATENSLNAVFRVSILGAFGASTKAPLPIFRTNQHRSAFLYV